MKRPSAVLVVVIAAVLLSATNTWACWFKKLPVGTIVASVLDETQFQHLAGKGWILADSSEIMGSKLADLTGMTHVPDMRGVFLRGMNVGKNNTASDPDSLREVGSFQADMLGRHGHGLNFWPEHLGGGLVLPNNYPVWKNQYNPNAQNATQHGVSNTGGSETRPKNVAVYYYIRIN